MILPLQSKRKPFKGNTMHRFEILFWKSILIFVYLSIFLRVTYEELMYVRLTCYILDKQYPKIEEDLSRGFLQHQLCNRKHQLFHKNSTVVCKYLFTFSTRSFLSIKTKTVKKCQYSLLFKKNIWKLIRNKVNVYN